mgnify:CR=1 FL=1
MHLRILVTIHLLFILQFFTLGYFHAYDIGSTVDGLDMWTHSGDFIYEYGIHSTYSTNAPERHAQTDPQWEIVEKQGNHAILT